MRASNANVSFTARTPAPEIWLAGYRLLSWLVLLAAFILFAPPKPQSNQLPWLLVFLVPLISPYVLALIGRLGSRPIHRSDYATPVCAGIRFYQRSPRHQRLNLSARGTMWHPMIFITGDLQALPAPQQHALIAHELAHLRGWDVSLSTLVFLLVSKITANPFLALAAMGIVSRSSEYRADVEAAGCTSPTTVMATLDRLDSRRVLDWAEWVPVFHLFLTHPSTAARIRRLQATATTPPTTDQCDTAKPAPIRLPATGDPSPAVTREPIQCQSPPLPPQPVP